MRGLEKAYNKSLRDIEKFYSKENKDRVKFAREKLLTGYNKNSTTRFNYNLKTQKGLYLSCIYSNFKPEYEFELRFPSMGQASRNNMNIITDDVYSYGSNGIIRSPKDFSVMQSQLDSLKLKCEDEEYSEFKRFGNLLISYFTFGNSFYIRSIY